jgi:plasmid stabilization system protein ParE
LAHRVRIQPAATADAQAHAAFIQEREQGPEAALKWLSGLFDVIESLSEMPNRFKVIDEQDAFDIQLRQLLYFSHRVIYHVDEESRSVHVLRVYHSARDHLDTADLDE